MADVLLGLLPDSGEGEAGLDSSKITRKYLVYLDDISKEVDSATTVSGLPTLFDAHPTFPYCRVRSISGQRRGNSSYWEVTVNYTSPDKPTEDEENDDPELDLATLNISYEDREEPVTGTLNTSRVYQAGIRNSAGEVFEPTPTRIVSNLILTITQNYGTDYAFLDTALSYMDCINSDTFLGLAAKTCRIVSVSPKVANRNDVSYLEVIFVIKVKPTWDLQLLDYGSYYLDSGNKVAFKTQDGEARTGLLNGSGGESATPVFLPDQQIYTKIAFSGLGLPSSLSGYKLV